MGAETWPQRAELLFSPPLFVAACTHTLLLSLNYFFSSEGAFLSLNTIWASPAQSSPLISSFLACCLPRHHTLRIAGTAEAAT
jgi:hypothetical protein